MTTTPPSAQKATKDGAATLLFEHLCNAEEERGIQKIPPKGFCWQFYSLCDSNNLQLSMLKDMQSGRIITDEQRLYPKPFPSGSDRQSK